VTSAHHPRAHANRLSVTCAPYRDTLQPANFLCLPAPLSTLARHTPLSVPIVVASRCPYRPRSRKRQVQVMRQAIGNRARAEDKHHNDHDKMIGPVNRRVSAASSSCRKFELHKQKYCRLASLRARTATRFSIWQISASNRLIP
jgi:hypothetical protein